MGALDGKSVFVAGGAGNIGGNVVRGCLRAGATVITASRDAGRFERLRRFVAQAGFVDTDKLITLEGDVGDDAGAQKVRDQVLEKAPDLDAVVASLGGGMPPQSLMGLDTSRWESVLRGNLTSHFVCARTFLPTLLERGRGAYVLLSGYGGETAWPENAPVSVAALGVIGLAKNLAAEHKKAGVRIKPMVLVTMPELWKKLEGTPGAFHGDDVGDFLAWLCSDAAKETDAADVIRYVTDWQNANVMLRA
mgnify:CR=1 FL=1|jgi:NAD(P)-dependent dehydrogenase (short-subunit alcohol dehydrogenase family)